MVDLQFLEGVPQFFLNLADNHPNNNNINNNNMYQLQNNNNNNRSINLNNTNNINIGQSGENRNMCQLHNSKIEYYCVHCDKYFCSSCLVFFGQEGQKHKNHLILGVSQMNDLGILEAVNEYKKLPQTKGDLEHLIGLCNLKLKENKIKNCEIEDNMNTIKNLYIKKLEESTQELETILKDTFIKGENGYYWVSSELVKQ